MPVDGHLSWEAVYKPGTLKAVGYKNGKKAMETKIETTGEAAALDLTADHRAIKADNRDVSVIAVKVLDKKGRYVPDADIDLGITVSGPVRILGVGNGDPTYRTSERPTDGIGKNFKVRTFNGLAQILVQATDTDGDATVTVDAEGIPANNIILTTNK